jgi:hypothetical protein
MIASLVLAFVLTIGFLSDRPSAGGSSDWVESVTLKLDDVRALAQKGDALKYEDFSDFWGADFSSNPNYHTVVYGVEGGYRLIVRTDGNQIDAAELERIWDSGGSGIDIRDYDVDEFVESHPSTMAPVPSSS